jgi:uncharacterized membrane protein YphA (DoxX/SURF4 family)
MIRILFGVFFVLHGLVHLLYFGQSARYFELQPGMLWPDGSWAFSRFLGNATTRNLAGILLILAAVGFVAGGAGIFLKQAWWRPAVVTVAAFSVVIYLLFWDGGLQYLDNKGGVGILINLAILSAVLLFQWPDFDF